MAILMQITHKLVTNIQKSFVKSDLIPRLKCVNKSGKSQPFNKTICPRFSIKWIRKFITSRAKKHKNQFDFMLWKVFFFLLWSARAISFFFIKFLQCKLNFCWWHILNNRKLDLCIGLLIQEYFNPFTGFNEWNFSKHNKISIFFLLFANFFFEFKNRCTKPSNRKESTELKHFLFMYEGYCF